MVLWERVQRILALADAPADCSLIPFLEQCQIVSGQRGNPDEDKWIDYEYNGYPDGVPVPDYRKVLPFFVGTFFQDEGTFRDIPISSFRDSLQKLMREPMGMRFGIAAIEERAHASGDIRTESPFDGLESEIPNCSRVYACFRSASFRIMRAGIRNRIVHYAIELEKEFPDKEESPPPRKIGF